MRRQFLALLLSVFAVCTTGLVGLVLEEWFPADGDFDLTVTPGWRLWMTIASAAGLGLVTWMLARGRGTLYYLRILSERAPDIHQPARNRAKARYLDYRSVTRSVTLGTANCVDLAAIVEHARSELQSAASGDDETTSSELAPNAHWPIEFAIGFDWPLADDTTLIEFHENRGEPAFEVSAAVPPIDVASIEEVGRGQTNLSAQLVHVHIHLSDGDVLDGAVHPTNISAVFGRTADHTLLWGVSKTASDSTITVGWQQTADLASVDVHPGKQLSPQVAAEWIARAILTALDTYPQAVVAVTAQIPKTVAVLAGRYFAGYLQWRPTPRPKNVSQDAPRMVAWKAQNAREKLCMKQYAAWDNSWSRLALLSYNESTRSMQALRVRDSQPVGLPPIPPAKRELLGGLEVRTPHALVVYNGDNIVFTHGSDGKPARLSEDRLPAQTLKLGDTGIPLIDLSYSDSVTDLPDQQDGIWIVVSRVTAQALPDRNDLVFPLDEVRDERNRIIGCRALGRFRPANGLTQ